MELYNPAVIRPLLERHGFHFSKSMGQNFLVKEWVPQRIVFAAGIDNDCGVLEIGPGIGVLTREQCAAAGRVVSVELDRSLLPVLQETLADFDNISVISGDVLKLDLPKLVSEEFSGLKPVVCANLPYNITTPLLQALLEPMLFSEITVMIQKEVAQRICARPGTSEYGAFTVFVDYYAEPAICFDVSPDCFFPQPKVTSTVIRLRRKPEPSDLLDRDLLFSVTRSVFAHRRKTLLNGLSPLFAERLSKQQIADVIQDLGYAPTVRGETLSLKEFISLSNRFHELIQ